jgi:tRNA U34 2-thiouridine synthase MnmA/TrmU
MKAWIQTTPDFDYEVIDVYLVIKSELLHLKGFNDDEWEEAMKFAEEVAATLGIEYIGEVGEANHELDES